jgi:SPP1 family predicted phage head-tail adaptor
MALAVGRLRHRVELQAPVETQSSSGSVSTAWVTQATVWAAIEPLSAREFIAAQSTQSQVNARIVIRRRSDITAKWRVLHTVRGTIYNIHGVLSDPDSGLEYQTLPVSTGVDSGR